MEMEGRISELLASRVFRFSDAIREDYDSIPRRKCASLGPVPRRGDKSDYKVASFQSMRTGIIHQYRRDVAAIQILNCSI